MKVEIDQSGKIGDTKVPTVLAFSNGKRSAILIPATVKRECLLSLREQGIAGKTIYMKLFAVGLYLLLKDHIHRFSQIIVDLEYPGRNAEIKLYLMNLLNRAGFSYDPTTIHFGQVGKKSRAHLAAFEVFVGEKKPDRQITTEEMLAEYLKK